MDKENILRDLGLSKNESKVYLSLLTLGIVSAGKVAERCKLHRTNVYDALERLIAKGLVSYVVNKNNVKTFEATDPNKLLMLIKEKEKAVSNIMPQLLLEKQLSQKKASAQVYEGLKAFKLAEYNLLKYNEPILAYGIPAVVPDAVKSYIMGFHRERIEKKIVFKHIYNEDAKDRIKILNEMEYTEAKYLPEEFNSPVTTMICGPEVLLINWAKPLTFIRIENEQLANAYKSYFDVLYKSATKKV